jgi:uncharacterized membrane protein YccF (DUF307 family)
MAQSTTLTVSPPSRPIPFLLRVAWFFLFGWELTAAWIFVAWFFNLTIVGLPLGLWMIDRVPQVLTLKPRAGFWSYEAKSGRSHFVVAEQAPLAVRALYFALIGWWFSLVWSIAAYVLCATIIFLPIGVLMLNALPFVTTLHR